MNTDHHDAREAGSASRLGMWWLDRGVDGCTHPAERWMPGYGTRASVVGLLCWSGEIRAWHIATKASSWWS